MRSQYDGIAFDNCKQPQPLPSVIVVMSTYNGERFLEEQIGSILGQVGVDVHLFVRDDGSTDGTVGLLERISSCDDRISICCGENVGVKNAFFHALKEAPKGQYYAFADQDDIWMPDKLSTALDSLASRSDRPALYCCNALVMDDQSGSTKPMYSEDPSTGMSLGALLSINPFPGMTMVFNESARDIFLRFYPGGVLYHDHWLFLLCELFGTFAFNTECHVRYRQHGGNVLSVGSVKTGLRSIATKVRFFKDRSKYGEYPLDLAAEKILFFCEKELESREAVRSYLRICSQYRSSVKNRISLLFSSESKRNDFIGSTILRFRILAGLF